MAEDLLGPIMDRVVNAAAAVLADGDRPVGRIINVQPGEEVAWDDCCPGQLAIRVVSIQPVAGNAKANGMPCGVLWWVATLGLSLIRCVATVSEKGVPPTGTAVSADGQTMLADLTDLQQVVICDQATTAIVQWAPLGPQGGCAGGEWTWQARYPACPC